MARNSEMTSTYVNINVKIMKAFKDVIRDEGLRLQKGLETALQEYTKKHKKEGKQ
jgi:hypothetical protein